MFALGLCLILLVLVLSMTPGIRRVINDSRTLQQASGCVALVGALLMIASPFVWLAQVLP